jgi:hypothetical protein
MGQAAGGALQVVLTGDSASLESALARGGAGMEKFRGVATSLAGEITGVGSAAARATSILGTLAIGGAWTTALILGITAVSATYNHFTEDIRKTREEHEKLISSLAQVTQAGLTNSIPGKIKTKAQLEADLQLALDQRSRAQFHQAQADMAGPLFPVSAALAAREVKEAEQAVLDATQALYAHNKALDGAIASYQTLDLGLTYEWAHKEGEAVRELTRLYGDLKAAKLPTTEEIFSGANQADWRELARESRRSMLDRLTPGLGSVLPSGQKNRRPGDFGASTDILDSALLDWQRKQGKATEQFSAAGQAVVNTFGAMAEAAITGSNQVAAAITSSLQAVVANLKTSSGGLFGATLPGALVGVGIGIIGSLFGRHHDTPPVKISNTDEIARKLAEANARHPIQIRNVVVSPDGRTIEETQVVLANREARDAVPRYTARR